jgi:hypothetical protein
LLMSLRECNGISAETSLMLDLGIDLNLLDGCA